MSSQYVDIPAADGSGTFRAYKAVPKSGKGPVLVVAQEIFGIDKTMRDVAEYYAEEGYVALVPDLFWRIQPGIELDSTSQTDFPRALELFGQFDQDKGVQDIQAALNFGRAMPEAEGTRAGVLGFCLGGKLAYLSATRTDADVSVGYYGVGIGEKLGEAANIKGRLVLHLAEKDGFSSDKERGQIMSALSGKPNVELYVYPGQDHAFARAGGAHYDKASALMAHQRSVTAMRREMGPHFDLEALWDKHCEYEFGTRNVADTMGTMVPEPYVNHIPTMTGGVGFEMLSRFYTNHFVNSNPPDTKLIPISRTVGATQVVDEMLFTFTHTTEIPWMLPGIAPTGKRVEVPLIGIIKFRGDKLYHEHIYWDQASVLVQVGLLDPSTLPVTGVEQGHKLLDETLPSNTLMPSWAGSEGK